MINFFYKLHSTTRHLFAPRSLPFHFAAILLTYGLVISGFDGWYFLFFRDSLIRSLLSPAIGLGFLVPLVMPFILWGAGYTTKNLRLMITGFALGQAGFLGLMLSFFYKALTGRAHPSIVATVDLSKVFNFGFWRSGVFWGWPSSHTTVAFALAATICALYPEKRTLRYVAIIGAFYVGLGVSMSIHWFSDFVAGAIFGSLVGSLVGKKFSERLSKIAG